MSKIISDYRCFFCFTRAYERLLEKEPLTQEQKSEFVKKMAQKYQQVSEDFSAPEYSRDLRNIFQTYSNTQDLYVEEKNISNELALSLYPELKKMVTQSDNPKETALRLALAGNVIDFGVHAEYDLEQSIKKGLETPFAIDNSPELFNRISQAKTILYLGDNSGEIVLDKLFLETLQHSNVYFAVRGAPVLNDVTIHDAKYVGIDSVAQVISNGGDVPSTVLSLATPEFLKVFQQADLIISKGQGNLEGLWGTVYDKIFFLSMVKCDVVADAVGVPKGSFVVMKQDT
ncbi:MAG: ARMT1-like domain-containing protein [Bacteroidales bacterium]